MGRNFLNESQKRFGDFVFTLNDFEDATKARIGLGEGLKVGVFEDFPVMIERSGNIVA